MNVKFYICRMCGNIVTKINDSGVPLVCCGEEMEELKVNTVDASQEKHVPVITRDGNKVNVVVGSVEHPMTNEHYIEWICLQTRKGLQIKKLEPNNKPESSFALEDDEVIAVFEYCNIHGLWMVKP